MLLSHLVRNCNMYLSIDNPQEFGYDPLSLWRPVVEPDFGQERFLTEDPMLSIREGRMHSVPFIVSQTTGEFFWKAFSEVFL